MPIDESISSVEIEGIGVLINNKVSENGRLVFEYGHFRG